jgi:hypothetical protein
MHARHPFPTRVTALLRGALAAACAAGVAGAAAACSGPSTARASAPSELAVSARGGVIELDNSTGRRVFYRIIERETSARVRWAPCVVGPDCQAFGPHSTVRLSYESVLGYAPGAREAVVFWWYAERTPAGRLAADSVRSVPITF